MRQRRPGMIAAILLAVLLAAGAGPAAAAAAAEPAFMSERAEARNLAVFDQAWRLVRDRFFDPDLAGLDWEAARERHRPRAAAAGTPEALSAAINAMLAELGASHTAHFVPSQTAYYEIMDIFAGALRRDIRRLFPDGRVAYAGIGIFTEEREGRTFVTGVLDGLPADRAGLQIGDEILSADGAPFRPVESFAGRIGRPVALAIRRAAGAAAETVTVRPRRIEPNRAFLEAMENSLRIIERDGLRIGYVHAWSYAGSDYQRLLERALHDGALSAADALVWDLRDGWGGAQPDYLAPFAGGGPTVALTARDGTVSLRNVRWRKPVVMLVNECTRSGKEILAHGFKTYGLGAVVGERTAGAVLAGRAFLLEDDSLLFLAVADVHVDGERLEGVGVAPTVAVPFDAAYAGGHDPQLERAIAILARQLDGS